MRRDEFSIEMARLVATFGKSSFPDERVMLILQEVELQSVFWFKRVVDKFIGEFRTAPLVTDFREEIIRERERQSQHQKDLKLETGWKPYANCDYCFDNGVYLCSHKTLPGVWAFRCHCLKGLEDPRTEIPHYKPDHAKEYDWYDPRRLKQNELLKQES